MLKIHVTKVRDAVSVQRSSNVVRKGMLLQPVVRKLFKCHTTSSKSRGKKDKS